MILSDLVVGEAQCVPNVCPICGYLGAQIGTDRLPLALSRLLFAYFWVIGVPASCADYLPGRCEVWGDVGQLGVWRVWLMDALRDQDAPKLAHKSYISWECDQVSSLVVRGWHASA